MMVVAAGGVFGGVVLFLCVTLAVAVGYGWRWGLGLYLVLMMGGLLWSMQQ
jgi:hypothetical protein